MTIDKLGTREWYNESGDHHRDDGPAIICSNGKKIWCQNGECHRTDGPAIIFPNGTKKWCQNGFLHRTDGPAIIWDNRVTGWCLNGKSYSFTEWADVLNLDHKQRLAMVLKWNPQ